MTSKQRPAKPGSAIGIAIVSNPHDPQSLFAWMSALVDYVRSGEPDLTRALNVSKPVVTRALNRLGTLGYLRRQRDDSDKRNIFVARTPEGADFLEEFGHFIGAGDAPGLQRASA